MRWLVLVGEETVSDWPSIPGLGKGGLGWTGNVEDKVGGLKLEYHNQYIENTVRTVYRVNRL